MYYKNRHLFENLKFNLEMWRSALGIGVLFELFLHVMKWSEKKRVRKARPLENDERSFCKGNAIKKNRTEALFLHV